MMSDEQLTFRLSGPTHGFLQQGLKELVFLSSHSAGSGKLTRQLGAFLGDLHPKIMGQSALHSAGVRRAELGAVGINQVLTTGKEVKRRTS